tara:strand:- start:1776 stop:2018 length:243 start_codon:yes stop_codon:yes gene_type:complete
MVAVLNNKTVLISEIEEVPASIPGEPDCKLVNPFEIKGDTLVPWLYDYTDERNVLISSDRILTLVEPKKTFIDKYKDLTK